MPSDQLNLNKLLCPEGHETLTIVSKEIANGSVVTYCSTCDLEYTPEELISVPVDRRTLAGPSYRPTVYGHLS